MMNYVKDRKKSSKKMCGRYHMTTPNDMPKMSTGNKMSKATPDRKKADAVRGSGHL